MTNHIASWRNPSPEEIREQEERHRHLACDSAGTSVTVLLRSIGARREDLQINLKNQHVLVPRFTRVRTVMNVHQRGTDLLGHTWSTFMTATRGRNKHDLYLDVTGKRNQPIWKSTLPRSRSRFRMNRLTDHGMIQVSSVEYLHPNVKKLTDGNNRKYWRRKRNWRKPTWKNPYHPRVEQENREREERDRQRGYAGTFVTALLRSTHARIEDLQIHLKNQNVELPWDDPRVRQARAGGDRHNKTVQNIEKRAGRVLGYVYHRGKTINVRLQTGYGSEPYSVWTPYKSY